MKVNQNRKGTFTTWFTNGGRYRFAISTRYSDALHRGDLLTYNMDILLVGEYLAPFMVVHLWQKEQRTERSDKHFQNLQLYLSIVYNRAKQISC
jgi:hypothetical protein